MDVFYKVGVTVGIFFLYMLLTWGLAGLITLCEEDDFKSAVLAWLFGMIAFIILAIFTLEKFNLWGGV